MSVESNAVFLVGSLEPFEGKDRGILVLSINYERMSVPLEHFGNKSHICVPQYQGIKSESSRYTCKNVGFLINIRKDEYEKNSFEEFFFRACIQSEGSDTILEDLIALQPDSFPWTKIKRREAVLATQQIIARRSSLQ